MIKRRLSEVLEIERLHVTLSAKVNHRRWRFVIGSVSWARVAELADCTAWLG
jgi:hypothetical protein